MTCSLNLPNDRRLPWGTKDACQGHKEAKEAPANCRRTRESQITDCHRLNAERRNSDTRQVRSSSKNLFENCWRNRVVCSDWFGASHDRQVPRVLALVLSVCLSRSGLVLFRLGREVRGRLDGVHARNRRSKNWPQLELQDRSACIRRESRALQQSVWLPISGAAQPRLARGREREQRDREEPHHSSVITERRSSDTGWMGSD